MQRISHIILKGSALRFVSLALTIAVGFYMMPFLIHSLGDEQYGLWIMVGAVISFYGLLDIGMSNAIRRFLVRAIHSDQNNDINTTLTTAVVLFTCIGILTIVITICIIVFSPFFIESETNKFLFQLTIGILGIKSAVVLPLYSFYGVLAAKYRFDLTSYIQMFSLTIRTALIIYFISHGFGIIAIAIITSLTDVMANMLAIYFAKKLVPEIHISLSHFSLNKLKEYYHFGKYTYYITISEKIKYSIDDLIAGAVVGISAVTHYTIAATLIFYFREAIASIFGVVSPAFNKYHKLEQWTNLREIFFVTAELTALGSVLMGGMLIAFGQPFIFIWIGENYSDSYVILLILCSASIIKNSQQPCLDILYAVAKHKYYAKINGFEAIANLCLSLILVQFYGLYGIALGTAIPAIINNLFFLPLYTCNQLKISVRRYFYIMLKLYAIGMVVFAPALALNNFYKLETFLDLVMAGGTASIIYVFICTKFVISDNTTQYIREVAPNQLKNIVKLLT